MPAPYGRRDWQTRADRALGRIGRGSQQGRFPGTRPVPPSGLSRPGTVDYRDFGQLHAVDEFTITDDSVATFTLSHEPMLKSWNVSMGWPFSEARFSISGRTLTITDPTDTFRGIAVSGPRTLHAQYDYLTAAPALNFADGEIHYRTVPPGESTVFWPRDFDDSGWAVISQPLEFGSGTFPIQYHDNDWPIDTDLQVRAMYALAAGVGVTVTYGVDDDATFYWNGVLVETDASGTATNDTIVIPGGDVLATNVLAIRATDINDAGRGLVITVAVT